METISGFSDNQYVLVSNNLIELVQSRVLVPARARSAQCEKASEASVVAKKGARQDLQDVFEAVRNAVKAA